MEDFNVDLRLDLGLDEPEHARDNVHVRVCRDNAEVVTTPSHALMSSPPPTLAVKYKDLLDPASDSAHILAVDTKVSRKLGCDAAQCQRIAHLLWAHGMSLLKLHNVEDEYAKHTFTSLRMQLPHHIVKKVFRIAAAGHAQGASCEDYDKRYFDSLPEALEHIAAAAANTRHTVPFFYMQRGWCVLVQGQMRVCYEHEFLCTYSMLWSVNSRHISLEDTGVEALPPQSVITLNAHVVNRYGHTFRGATGRVVSSIRRAKCLYYFVLLHDTRLHRHVSEVNSHGVVESSMLQTLGLPMHIAVCPSSSLSPARQLPGELHVRSL